MTLCEILKAFSRTESSEVMPCAGFELKRAVNQARIEGYLKRDGNGFLLSDSGASLVSSCRGTKKKGVKKKKK